MSAPKTPTKRTNGRKVSCSANNTTSVSPESIFKLKSIVPITRTQNDVFKAYSAGKNLWLAGSAGTGKSFIALYLALHELETSQIYKKVAIVRSAVETRAIGALPGDLEEKTNVYELPYQSICEELYGQKRAYQRLKAEGIVDFIPTSFIRGRTIFDTIIIVDEAQNCSLHELDSIITRCGKNCRIIFCGDLKQSDLTRESERKGFLEFESIVERMQSFELIDFTTSDIVRSGLVKEYLIAAET